MSLSKYEYGGYANGRSVCGGGAQNEAITAGTGDDFFQFTQAAGLTHADVINGGAGTDTIEINNNSNTNFTSVVDLQDVTKVEVVKTIEANGDDTTTAEADVVLAVDGSSITKSLLHKNSIF